MSNSNRNQSGWKLVPIEPTQEMIDEACSSAPHAIIKYTKPEERNGSIPLIPMATWRAMVASAPSAPEGWGERELETNSEDLKVIRDIILDHWLPDSSEGDDTKADLIRRIHSLIAREEALS